MDNHADDATPTGGGGMSSFCQIRYRFAALRLGATLLGRQIRRFGTWLESRALPAAGDQGRSVARFEVDPDGGIRLTGMPRKTPAMRLDDCQTLCDFLTGIGIERLELDPRLECGQISDILTFLYAQRRGLARGAGGRHGSACRKIRETGLRLACAKVHVSGQTLEVAYSYCMTRFSRVVKWFERRHQTFTDHRALFHAAPYYAMLPAAVFLAIFLVYALWGNWWVFPALMAAGAIVLCVLTYLFFMIVGSVEYDNEEREYRLRQAHDELKRYADRTQADLARARDVQQSLIPEPQNMPLPDKIEWAGSFVPEIEVGGDYFDATDLGRGRAAILFADVCGHGMSAALITAILKTTFQAWADDGAALEAFVRQANQNLYRFTPEGSFAVLVIAIYDSRSRRLSYVNCGHSPEPVRIPPEAAEPMTPLTERGSMLLGVIEDIEVRVSEQPVAPGEKLLFLTDGLVEAMRDDGEMYGRERLDECLQANRHKPIAALVDAIVEDVQTFTGGAPATDDRTVLALRTL